jgi:hypothetical protein
MASIERHSPTPLSVACDTVANIANCTEIPMADYAGGIIIMPATTTAALLKFHVAGGDRGRPTQQNVGYVPTYQPLYDDNNAQISRVVAQARAYRIPLETFGAGNLKIVSDVAVTVEVLLKG